MLRFDVIVLGAGLTGSSVFRDCALRGLAALLIEADDIGGGASGAQPTLLDAASSAWEPERRRRVADEIQVMRGTGAFLLRQLPLLRPFAFGRTAPSPAQLLASGRGVGRRVKGARDTWTILRGAELQAFEPNLADTVPGAVLSEAWLLDVQRLIQANVSSGRAAGGEVQCGARVTSLLHDGDQVAGVAVREQRTGESEQFAAKLVVNATGAGAQALAQLGGADLPIGVRRDVWIRLHQRPTFSAVVLDAGGWLVPCAGGAVVGPLTASASQPGAPPSQEEVAWLIEQTRRIVGVGAELRCGEAWSTATATWGRGAGHTSGSDRAAQVFDHAASGSPGLLTVVGGIAAEHRWLAERVTDQICRALQRAVSCRTRVEPLSGGDGDADAQLWSQQFSVAIHSVEGLIARHGADAHTVLRDGEEGPGRCAAVCRCADVTAAEVQHAVRRELAVTIEGISRRTGLAKGGCRGLGCAAATCQLLHDHTNRSGAEYLRELCEAKEQLFAAGRGALNQEQAATLALDQLAHRLSAGLDRHWLELTDAEGAA